MPTAIVAAIAGSFAAEAVAEYAVFSLGWGSVATALAYGTTSFLVSSTINSVIGGSRSSPSTPNFNVAAAGRTQVVRSAVASRQIVYGRTMVSGPLIFAASSGPGNGYLNLVIALAGHECDAIEEIRFNDIVVGTIDGDGAVVTGEFAYRAQIFKHLGAADQEADAYLIGQDVGWTDQHRLRGVCYLVVKLIYDRDVYPTGIPNIKALVRGKKLYDPRTTGTVWSQNVALQVRDYLTADYGLASTSAEVDDAAIIAAANICDESIALADSGSESRYTGNGVLDTGATPRSNMEALLSACAGALTWPAGLWTLHAGAYETPVMALDEDDLAGAIQVRARVQRQDLYNAIKGTYVSPETLWQPVDFPPVSNATYAAQDAAQIFRDISLPMTTSSATAQRLAKLMVEKSRQGITVQAPFKLGLLKTSAWDNVTLSIASLGWSAKVFKITEWQFDDVGSINLTLQEEAAACYAWSAEETTLDPAPDTNLPNPLAIDAPGIPSVAESLYDTTGSSGVKAMATMSWFAPGDAFTVDYLPEYRIAAGAWVVLPATTGLSAEIRDIAPGSYEFRVRARNTLGVLSAYSGVGSKEILGLTAPPSAVGAFSVISSNGVAIGSWALSQDLDVRIGGRIVVRWTPLTAGAVWENGIDVGDFNGDAVGGLLPMLTGTYLAKAKDSIANWSVDAATFVLTAGSLTALPNSLTVTEHTAFAGTRSGVAVVDGALKLDGSTLIDSMATLVDSWGYIDSLGGIAGAGTYDFASGMDFGSVVARRITPTIQALAFDTADLIDARGMVDDWDSVDGTTVNDATAVLLAAISNDAVNYGSWFPMPAGDVTCRAIKYRLSLASAQPTHNIAISQLSVTANW